VPVGFTPSHRGGSGAPLVCLHGLADTWRTWQLVLPALERRHDVLALTLPGHAGGPPLPAEVTDEAVLDLLEAQLDEAGMETAHLVGNSFGGYLAIHLAARGRAASVVAFSPGGGFGVGDGASDAMLDGFDRLYELARVAAPNADAIVSTAEGRRRATRFVTERFEHIPAELLAHQLVGVAACDGLLPLLDLARREGWSLDAERVTCPVRVVWGTADRILPWPAAAARYRDEWLPHAEWIELDGVGHCPQLDVPLVTAELVLRFTGA
jgi:pimeloyl-ACP methyl ester carboxylesterase